MTIKLLLNSNTAADIPRRGDEGATTPDQIAGASVLALKSIQLARRRNFPTEPDAIQTIRSGLIKMPLMVVSQGSATVRSLAVLSDGRLAAASDDHNIRIWPTDGVGKPVILTRGGWILSLAVLADGRLASGYDEGEIKIGPKIE
jgi:WD40 repeat protein